jgi:hypothetical protein
MTLADIEAFEWFGTWEAITNDVERQFLESELMTTLHAEHILYKRPVTAVARRTDSDDVLFLVRGRVDRVGMATELAEVHLSYSTERTADFPASVLFATLDEWKNATI